MDGINTILRYVQYALVPTAILLGISQFSNFGRDGWRHAIAGIVAGVVAMVPEGLVLLTSLAFGLAAVTLARRNVLVQELPAVEVLARVDVVLLDKTGTLTEGTIQYDEFEPLADDAPIADALGALAADENRNGTMRRARRGVRRASGMDARGRGPVLVGAQVECGDVHRPRHLGAGRARDRRRRATTPSSDRAEELAATGRRVLLLARSDASVSGEELPDGPAARGVRPLRGEDPRRRGGHVALLPRAGRDVQGDLRRQPADGRRGRRAGGSPRCRPAGRRARAAGRPRRARRHHRTGIGVRAGDAASEAGDRRGVATTRHTWSQ